MRRIFKATPHKDRAAHTLTSFLSFLPKTPSNTPVFLRRFGQSDEKADCASARQSLCGVALILSMFLPPTAQHIQYRN